MANGTLLVQTAAARLSSPVAGVSVLVTGDGFSDTQLSDSEGNTAAFSVPTPACHYSLEESNSTVLPYAIVNVVASLTGYRTVTIEDVQIFPDQLTVVSAEMITSGGEAEDIPDPAVLIPVHALFAGTGGSGPAPIDDCSEDANGGVRVLEKVIIPTKITVHLGKPAASAQNVTVGFQEYIANVASSEVYPTWAGRYLHFF